jgi:ABC-2 type transport system permease protein
MTALAGARTMGSIQRRTSWKALTGWVLGLAAMLGGTAFAVHGSYDTPAKIHEYAAAVGSGDALVAINGRIAGLDSLGGVIANEFGFIAAFALPLMGISLVARLTRREEDSGRLDLLTAGRIGRAAPVLAAAGTVATATLLTSVVFALCLVAVGIPTAAAVLYAASLGALALCFAGVAALAAQAVSHARGVYAAGLGALAVAYLVRGAGDALDTWVAWLSPLGWAEKTQAFGDRRWWPLLLPLAVAVGAVAAAVVASGRRDVGSALVSQRPLASRANRRLRRPLGLALRLGRGSLLGWTVVAVLVSGMFGALTKQAAGAIGGNDALRRGLGGAGATGADVLIRLDLLLLTLVAAAYTLQWVGTLHDEETGERLEVTLSGTTSRPRWLAGQVVGLVLGLAVVGLAGTAALSLSAAWSLDDSAQVARLAGSAAAYLPVVVVLAAAAVALFGARPRWFGLGWAWLVLTAVVALLGPALKLPGWVTALSPTDHVGDLPGGSVDGTGLVGLCLAAALLVAVAFVGFRRRDLPQR